MSNILLHTLAIQVSVQSCCDFPLLRGLGFVRGKLTRNKHALCQSKYGEFKRKEDMQKDMESLHNNMKSIFPEMRLFLAMEVSETASVYQRL